MKTIKLLLKIDGFDVYAKREYARTSMLLSETGEIKKVREFKEGDGVLLFNGDSFSVFKIDKVLC